MHVLKVTTLSLNVLHQRLWMYYNTDRKSCFSVDWPHPHTMMTSFHVVSEAEVVSKWKSSRCRSSTAEADADAAVTATASKQTTAAAAVERCSSYSNDKEQQR